jgi:hypothetical protein
MEIMTLSAAKQFETMVTRVLTPLFSCRLTSKPAPRRRIGWSSEEFGYRLKHRVNSDKLTSYIALMKFKSGAMELIAVLKKWLQRQCS